ncbi:13455_t:CDS:2 [Funneliformis mosseae]|uniref:13455_t:CDS:1 n=1 Tax=Funneliformis mosseae TaxID=27381 RepID=A0A9N8W0E8_FUNMO|nr:13455_t:CDS:2 [Funneliformis mosseae]
MISQKLYEKERKKSLSEDDFFILFTFSDNINIEFLEQSEIVDNKVFSDYFRLFANRVYKILREGCEEVSGTDWELK